MGKASANYNTLKKALLLVCLILLIIAVVALAITVWVLAIAEFTPAPVTFLTFSEKHSTFDKTTFSEFAKGNEHPFKGRGQYARAAVASDNGVCSEIGRDTLVAGGNAVDAAIATTACESVMNPHSGGFGGGHLASIYLRKERRCISINARERAPINTNAHIFDHQESLAFKGWKAIAVPGELHGLYSAYKNYGSGRLTWPQVLAPVIELARDGHFLSTTVAKALRSSSDTIEMLEQRGEFVRPFINSTSGRAHTAGAVIRRPAYADFLQRLADATDPIEEFYTSNEPDSIAQHVLQELKENGAYVDKQDLAEYESVIDDTSVYPFADEMSACAIGLPSGNPITIGLLRIMSEYKIGALDSIESTAAFWHKFNDASRFFYAARQAFGDPAFVPDARRIADLIMNGTMSGRIRELFDEHSTHRSASDYYLYNTPEFIPDDKGTTHISVVDEDGNAVSLTSTINSYFGAKVGSASMGFFWNNEMDDFALPLARNQFGIPPSRANFIAPGKRPLSSMSPSIVVDDRGDVRLVMGAAGGTRITTGTALIGIRTLLLNESVDAAMVAPRMHDQLSPNATFYESFINPAIVDALRAYGYRMLEYEGRLSVVTAIQRARDRSDSIRWLADSDPRKGPMSYPAGY